ncbi:PhoH family protein [Croceimicrobium sp.]|uniref:PhoH family protein n=1 Tax=Croceimicrobium sp. TaxID=2828340 RepID=UPI003BAD6DFF
MPAKAKAPATSSKTSKSTKTTASKAKTTTRKSRAKKDPKIFVLDTSVILYDHNSIMNFDEHDVAIPITVLEELDEFKKGSDTKNYEARQFIRLIDRKAGEQNINDWISLNGGSKGSFKVIMDTRGQGEDAQRIFGAAKNDHKILNAALNLSLSEPDRKVILVTKDINLRLKAKALNITAEDYETGKIKDVESLYTGKTNLEDFDQDLIDKLYKSKSLGVEEVEKAYPNFKKINNHFYILKASKSSTLSFYNAQQESLDQIEKKSFYGIKPRNAEQAFALHAIANPDVKLVTLSGVAGTGKTLLALAGALEQRRDFKQIYLARPIVPLSNKDIGFLPGDMKAKINPYMQPLWDNLKFIKNQFKEQDKEYKQIDEMVNSEKLLVTPLAYIRGRSLSNVIFIVDEAQNLTPHEVKTIITRAGENSKFVFTGDVNQIDTPYLDEQSNGLSYLIDKIKGNKLFAHVLLEKGERSELANLANDLL